MDAPTKMRIAGLVLLAIAASAVESGTWWLVIAFGWLGLACIVAPTMGQHLGERLYRCRCCGHHIFIADLGECGLIWSHYEDINCDDPTPTWRA